jgi:hypothetical protein
MTNHPRQREMWEGLTLTGGLAQILTVIVFLLIIKVFVL